MILIISIVHIIHSYYVTDYVMEVVCYIILQIIQFKVKKFDGTYESLFYGVKHDNDWLFIKIQLHVEFCNNLHLFLTNSENRPPIFHSKQWTLLFFRCTFLIFIILYPDYSLEYGSTLLTFDVVKKISLFMFRWKGT